MRNMLRAAGTTALTTATLASSFAVLGGFGLLGWKLEGLARGWESEAPLYVYVREGLPGKRLDLLSRRLRGMAQVRTVTVITPSRAMAVLKRSLGDSGKVLDGIQGPLLPPSVEVQLRQGFRSPRAVARFARTVGSLSEVKEVDYAREWVKPLWGAVTLLRTILVLVTTLLVVATVLVSGATVSLSMGRHRDELEIMRLVGATDRFIQMPYLIEAALVGWGASAVALGAIYAAFRWSSWHLISATTALGSGLGGFIPWYALLAFVGGAGLLCVAGAFLASWRILRRAEGEP